MGYVYFIEAIGQSVFKIGKAEALPTRFNQLDTASPCELDIWGVIKSDHYDRIEKELHHKFRKQRLKKKNGRKKEWFAISRSEAAQSINHYGGFYTADSEAKDAPIKKAIVDCIPIWNDIFNAIDMVFPTRKPNITIMAITTSIFFIAQALMPTVMQTNIPKGVILICMAYMLLLVAFCLHGRKIIRAAIIFSALYLRYLTFDNTYDDIDLLVKSRFWSSILSSTIFILCPVIFYRIVFSASKFLDEPVIKKIA